MIVVHMQAQNILEGEVHRLEEKYEAISQLDNLKNNVETLKKDLAWAFVTQEEKVSQLVLKINISNCTIIFY